jgi:ankyrin repeat protein
LEVRQQQFTPLHLAIYYGHADVALELIENGADIHALDPLGGDPLMICAMSNGINDEDAVRVARVLLERGVDPCSPRGVPEEGPPNTPLDIARIRKKAKLAKVLQEFGATK